MNSNKNRNHPGGKRGPQKRGNKKIHLQRQADKREERDAEKERRHDDKKTVKEQVEIARLDHLVQTLDDSNLKSFSDYPISEYMKKGLGTANMLYQLPSNISRYSTP